MSRHYNRGVITEELLSITEGFREAVILRQFLFWLPRMADVDQYVEEVLNEPERKSNGWIYKSASVMAEEIMCASRATVARRIESLVEAGYLDKRKSQRDMDTTNEYRVNPSAIESDLNEHGYSLATVVQGKHWPTFERLMKQTAPLAQSEHPLAQSEHPLAQSEHPPAQSEQSPPAHNAGAPSETTTETTTEKEEKEKAHARTGADGGETARWQWVPEQFQQEIPHMQDAIEPILEAKASDDGDAMTELERTGKRLLSGTKGRTKVPPQRLLRQVKSHGLEHCIGAWVAAETKEQPYEYAQALLNNRFYQSDDRSDAKSEAIEEAEKLYNFIHSV